MYLPVFSIDPDRSIALFGATLCPQLRSHVSFNQNKYPLFMLCVRGSIKFRQLVFAR